MALDASVAMPGLFVRLRHLPRSVFRCTSRIALEGLALSHPCIPEVGENYCLP